jgi:phosphatidylserine/phosphatidylglycerophosphate/cardiolipin synthase-like enzyme
MTKILSSSETTFCIEKIITNAEQKLTIISPYVKIHNRLNTILLEKQDCDIELGFVYGKNSDIDKKLIEDIKSFNNFRILHNKNLHAKIYANEKECLITSMNLYDYSQAHNYEIGVLINKDEEPNEFLDVMTIQKRIIRGSELQYSSEVETKSQIPKKEYKKLSVSQLAKQMNVTTERLEKLFIEEELVTKKNNNLYLTERGKEFGGSLVKGKYGYFTVWSSDIVER